MGEADVDDELVETHLAADIDDVAVLDAQIEDDESSMMKISTKTSPSSMALRKTRLPPSSRRSKRSPRGVETGVGPAFIEPDFGDILSDPPTSTTTRMIEG